MVIKIDIKWIRRIIIFILALACLLGTLAFTIGSVEMPDKAIAAKIKMVSPRVTVLQRRATVTQTRVTARGTAVPRFKATVVSEVTARVVNVSGSLAGGRRVKKGELLATLDSTSYENAVASAETALADAEVALLMEENKARQARAEWKRARLATAPASPLLLRQPQLKAAEAKVASARQSLVWAKKQLANTKIRAPFNAIVVSRKVSPGSFLQPGQAVATLYSSDSIEIRLLLSPGQWSLLPDEPTLVSGERPVVLTTDEGGSWSGTVIRVEHHTDVSTRQRALVVCVKPKDGEQGPLLPGSFVEASIPGKQLDRIMALPETSLANNGYIWFVTPDNTLARYRTKPVFRSGKQIFIRPPGNMNTLNALKLPMSSYLPGMKVEMQEDAKS